MNLTVVMVAIIVIAILAGLYWFRPGRGSRSVEGKIRGLGSIKAGSQQQPGATLEDVTAGRNATARDETGGGAAVRRTEAKGDVSAINTIPPKDNRPKV